jgi:hypothetical protein
MVSENRVLRRIFGPKREDIAGIWKRLHNEELHNLYASPNAVRVIKSRRIRWEQHVACEMRNAYKILDRKPEGKGTLRRPKHRWEENIRLDLRERGWEGEDWMHLTWDKDQGWALVNRVMNLWVP